MATGSRSTNTMAESLRGMVGDIADMKSMPDADIAYLTNLETQILRYLRAPFEATQQAQQLGNPAQPGVPGVAPPGMGAGGPPGMMPPGAAGPPGMPPGGPPGMGPPGMPPGGPGPAAQLLLGGGGGPVPGMASPSSVNLPPGLAMLAGLASANRPRVPGVMRGPNMPAGDELRRMLNK